METLRKSTERYLRAKRSSGAHSAETTRLYRSVLARFVKHVGDDTPVGSITKRHAEGFLGLFGDSSANTRASYTKVLRAYATWLVDDEQVPRNFMRAIPPTRVPRSAPRVLNADEAARLIACAITAEDRVIVTLGLQLGMRRGELARLEVGDLDFVTRTVLVRGKGGNERVLPLTVMAEVAARALAAQRRPGPLLGRSANWIGDRARMLLVDAGVKTASWDGIGMHALRRTAATDVYDGSGDVLVVQEMLGHASLATTQRYVAKRAVGRLRAAMEGRAYGTPA